MTAQTLLYDRLRSLDPALNSIYSILGHLYAQETGRFASINHEQAAVEALSTVVAEIQAMPEYAEETVNAQTMRSILTDYFADLEAPDILREAWLEQVLPVQSASFTKKPKR